MTRQATRLQDGLILNNGLLTVTPDRRTASVRNQGGTNDGSGYVSILQSSWPTAPQDIRFGDRVEVTGSPDSFGTVTGPVTDDSYGGWTIPTGTVDANNLFDVSNVDIVRSGTWTFGIDGSISLPPGGVFDSNNSYVSGSMLKLGNTTATSFIVSAPDGTTDSNYGKSILIQGSKSYNGTGTPGGDVTIAGGWTDGGSGAHITVYGGGGEGYPSPSRGNVDITAGYDGGSVDGPTDSLNQSYGGYYHGGQIRLNTSRYANTSTSTWVFDVYGNITLPSDGDIVRNGVSVLGGGGTLSSFGTDQGVGSTYESGSPALFTNDDMVIRTGGTAANSGGGYGQMYIMSAEDITIGTATDPATLTDATSLVACDATVHIVPGHYNSGNSYVEITAGSTSTWKFDISGGLSLPTNGIIKFQDLTTQQFAPSIGVGPSHPYAAPFPSDGGVAGTDYQFFFDIGNNGYPSMQSYSSAGGYPTYNTIWSVEYWIDSLSSANTVANSSGAVPVPVNNTGGVVLVGTRLLPGDYVVARVQNLDTGRVYRATFLGSYNVADEGNETQYGSIIVERLI